jgi:serine/threonine protein kinase
MTLEKSPNAEPIRGYRLIEPIGSGGFGEVWKCEAPGGIFKAVKFVHGTSESMDERGARAEEELRALQHIKSIRHPFLLSIDRVEIVDNELVIITELADQNLQELLQKYHALGKPGVPRDEILTYLREAAEVLDLMNFKFDLQHLDIKPRNLFLVSNHVKVADFGLVNTLAGSSADKMQIGAVTPLYAAPELFMSKLSRHCDQYSLAIVFQELLTGTLPFGGRNSRQLLLQHTQAEPDLSRLPAEDRPIIGRALAKNPDHRFASCAALVRALMGEAPVVTRPTSDPEFAPAVRPAEPPPPAPTPVRAINGPALPNTIRNEYRFLESLGSSPLVESWKVQSPVGRFRQLKILYGFNTDPKKLHDMVARLRNLHHPGLTSCDLLHVDQGRVVVLTDLVKETVRDRYQKCLSLKIPGIPRSELVDYLRAAAEVLDYLYQQHGIQHLSLNPRSFVLNQGWLQICDFGLAQLLWLPAGQEVAARNVRYSPPELFEGRASSTCDQFSLAAIYCEMLTGHNPFRNATRDRRRDQPILDSLAPHEAAVIRRALDPDPARRWPNCTDMLLALEGSPAEDAQEDRFHSLIQSSRKTPTTPLNLDTVPNPIPDIDELIRSILGESDASITDSSQIQTDTGTLSHRFQVNLPIGTARIKLDGFCRQWYGHIIRDDEQGLVIHLTLPTNFWQQWMGRQPGLEIRILLSRVNPATATPIEVGVHISAFRCSRKRAFDLLDEMGASIIDSLRRHLLVNSEKRTQDRVVWPHPIRVIPVDSEGVHEDPVECRGKDISKSGIGFYLPHELTTSEVLIELPSASQNKNVQLPAMLVRAKPCADGWYEVGALFRVQTLRKSQIEMVLPAAAVGK